MKRNYLTPSVKLSLREQADVLTASFAEPQYDAATGDHIVNWDGSEFLEG